MKPLKRSDVIKYLHDINKEKMKSLDAWIWNRSIKEHLLLYKVELNEDSLPEVTIMHTCWRWLACEIILLMHTSCPAHLVCKGKKYALVSAWFKISYRTWKIDQKTPRDIDWINPFSHSGHCIEPQSQISVLV